jgi:hypothetical protein
LLKFICYVKYFFRKFMSGAEFERRDRRDRSNGDELIPRVSRKTWARLRREILKVPGSDDHLVATYLEEIGTVNPLVVEYIKGVAERSPEGRDSACVAMAGVLVYKLLELEFEQRGKKMPIVQRKILDSLKVDPDQEESYFLELANSLFRENYELLRAFYTFWLNVDISNKLIQVSALGVYALIKAQAEVNILSGL